CPDRRLNAAGRSQPAMVMQKRQFPKRDRGNGELPFLFCSTEFASSIPRKATGVGHHPDQDVGIQQDHFRASQSSSGTTGDTMSPSISIFPLSESKALERDSLAGTSFAIGLPRLVITTGVRVEWT